MVSLYINATATATVTSVGTTLGDVLLTTKMCRSSTALARAEIDLDIIYKVALTCHCLLIVLYALVYSHKDSLRDLLYGASAWHLVV